PYASAGRRPGAVNPLYSGFVTKMPPPPKKGRRNTRLRAGSRRLRQARNGRNGPAKGAGRLVSVAFAGLRGEVLLELAFDTLELVGIRRRVLFLGDIRPVGRILGVQLQPLFEPALGVGQDRFGRAFWFAHAAVDAFGR